MACYRNYDTDDDGDNVNGVRCCVSLFDLFCYMHLNCQLSLQISFEGCTANCIALRSFLDIVVIEAWIALEVDLISFGKRETLRDQFFHFFGSVREDALVAINDHYRCRLLFI